MDIEKKTEFSASWVPRGLVPLKSCDCSPKTEKVVMALMVKIRTRTLPDQRCLRRRAEQPPRQ